MAYAKTAQLKGDSKSYRLSKEIKKYSLLDVGFIESKNGKFQLERPLDPDRPANSAFYLKMTVKPDLSAFKMTTTTANGLQQINIFKKNSPEMLEQLNYILKELEDRKIIEQVD